MKTGHFFRKYLLLFVMTGMVLASQTAAQTTNRAALVVSFGEGHVETSCVEFSEPELTGLEVLQRAGMDVEAQVQGLGAAVCRIDGTGCPGDNCFCQCTGGGSCRFWNYWHLVDGQWQFSQAGGGIYPVQDGAVEGWSWSVGSPGGNSEQPPVYNFDQICAPAVTDTPMPSNTPMSTGTAVPATHTPLPPTPTAMPEPVIHFGADVTTLVAGTCTVLRWDVEHITAVFLNDIGVEGHGSQEVCPAQTTTYTLHIIYPEGEENRQITVSVMILTATPVPPTPFEEQQVTDNLVAATVLPTAIATTTTMPAATIITKTEATAIPGAQAAPTGEFVQVLVPLLPTATEAATSVPSAPMASSSPPTATSSAVSQWLHYGIFGMIIFGLGAMLLLGRK